MGALERNLNNIPRAWKARSFITIDRSDYVTALPPVIEVVVTFRGERRATCDKSKVSRKLSTH